MSLALVFVVGGLTSIGIYLVTARSLSRVILGFALLGHAAVVALIAAGGPAGAPPIADGSATEASANPLPQALALTAIVISFGLTLFLLALATRQHQLTGDDLVEDDLEDVRIALLEEDEFDLAQPSGGEPGPNDPNHGDAGSGRSATT